MPTKDDKPGNGKGFTPDLHKHEPKMHKPANDTEASRLKDRADYAGWLNDELNKHLAPIIPVYGMLANKTLGIRKLAFCPGCLQAAVDNMREMAGVLEEFLALKCEEIPPGERARD